MKCAICHTTIKSNDKPPIDDNPDLLAVCCYCRAEYDL